MFIIIIFYILTKQLKMRYFYLVSVNKIKSLEYKVR